MSLQKQKGAVIVIALFFVTLVVTMAYIMMSRLARDTYRTSLLLRSTQAEYYAAASVDWAKGELFTNLANQKPDQPVDNIPIVSPENEVNGYRIESRITDMQAKINLNNLNTQEGQTDFKQLMNLLYPSMSEEKRNEIVLAVTDWIRPEQQQNEYNQYYMSLPTPYRAAHRIMTSASELKLVKGVTPELYKVLEPYIAALPQGTLINIQTAPAPVIAAISPGMTLETAKAIEKARAQTKIASKEAFLNLDVVKNHTVPENKFGIVSQYFLVETIVSIEKQKLVLYTLLERANDKSRESIKVIWQSKGISG